MKVLGWVLFAAVGCAAAAPMEAAAKTINRATDTSKGTPKRVVKRSPMMEYAALDWQEDDLINQIIRTASEKKMLDDEDSLGKLYELIYMIQTMRNSSKGKSGSSPMSNYYYRKMLI